jgi:hypothetical protein
MRYTNCVRYHSSDFVATNMMIALKTERRGAGGGRYSIYESCALPSIPQCITTHNRNLRFIFKIQIHRHQLFISEFSLAKTMPKTVYGKRDSHHYTPISYIVVARFATALR